jgi:hypothetical protein
MKLRIGPELQRHLAIVKRQGFSAAEAVSRAARRWERLGKPDLAGIETGTTYGGTAVPVRAGRAGRGKRLHDHRRGVRQSHPAIPLTMLAMINRIIPRTISPARMTPAR